MRNSNFKSKLLVTAKWVLRIIGACVFIEGVYVSIYGANGGSYTYYKNVPPYVFHADTHAVILCAVGLFICFLSLNFENKHK